MIEKRPFTQKGKVYIGFFPKELEILPFNFKIAGKSETFEVTQEMKDMYEAKLTSIGVRVEIPTSEFYDAKYKPIDIGEWTPGIIPPPNELEDAFIERLTIRDIFSIYHKVEESNKPFLNNLIRKYNKK